MAIKLEQIEEMNLQVGDKIEISFQDNYEKLRYFQSSDKKYIYVSKDKLNKKIIHEGEVYSISQLQNITVLAPKK